MSPGMACHVRIGLQSARALATKTKHRSVANGNGRHEGAEKHSLATCEPTKSSERRCRACVRASMRARRQEPASVSWKLIQAFFRKGKKEIETKSITVGDGACTSCT